MYRYIEYYVHCLIVEELQFHIIFNVFKNSIECNFVQELDTKKADTNNGPIVITKTFIFGLSILLCV